MANYHDYILYNNTDNIVKHKKKQLEFFNKEYRFNIRATKENHKIVDKFFKDLLPKIMEMNILNIDYYKWEKEERQ